MDAAGAAGGGSALPSAAAKRVLQPQPQQQAGGGVIWPATAAETAKEKMVVDARTMQLFPTRSADGVVVSTAPAPATQERRRPEAHATPSAPATAPTAPLTIVYGGQVLVFEHYTAEAAEKLVQKTQLLLAAGGGNNNDAVVTTPLEEPPMPPPPQMPAASGVSAGGVMPIARKASLQRFLQKRKQK
uniref:Protein TIFY n=1 Tax=Oryza punctata TaxID=4537 RepID=A0A0E0KEQ2_ORYPU